MDVKTVFTKTAKGVTQVNQKTQSLSRQLTKVLKAIDGKSSVAILADKVDLVVAALEKELNQLKNDGFIKIFEVRQEEPISEFGGDEDDFDFTAPAKMAGALNEPAISFGPSKYRTGLNDRVDGVASVGAVDEAAKIAAQIAARKKQDEDTRIAGEALAAAKMAAQQAQATARARAEREAQIRARLEVEAQARKDAEARVIEEARRAEIAATKSRAELETRIAEESQKRAELAASHARLTQEQQAQGAAAQRALAEARAKAEAEAKAFAAARAKIEIETKALAEARAQAEVASKRQEEELAAAQRELRAQLKAEIEIKVRAEMEELLKSDIDESARPEVEAAIRAEARDEARRQLEEQLAGERTSLAKIDSEARKGAEVDAKRMLAEQETRLRAEMDERLQEMAAEKAQVEMEARRMVDAQTEAAAKAAGEFAARLKTEEEARRVAEAEADVQRRRDEAERIRLEAIARNEAVARAKADAEAKALGERLLVEAEARAQIEAAAVAQRSAEQLRNARLQKRADEEAEARQKSDAEMQGKLAQEKQARIEAEALAALEADRHESAKRAQEEAEARARRETKAREIASNVIAEQAAQNEKIVELAEQRIAEEREARERAEAKAYADERAEEAHRLAQVARLRELAEQAEHAKLAQGEIVSGKKNRPNRKKEVHVGRWIIFAVVTLIAGSIFGLQVMPLNAVNSRMEKALSEWLHDDVSSQGLRVALFPKPHVKIDQISLGNGLDAKATSGKIFMAIGAIFGDKFVIESMELNNVTISAEALPRALNWANAANRGTAIEIGKIVLKNVKLEAKGVAIDVFDGELTFNRKGEISRAHAKTRDGKWTLDVSPDKSNPPVSGVAAPWVIDFSARNWTPPIGASIPFLALTAKGVWLGDEMVFTGMEAKLLDGLGKGDLKVNLTNGIAAQADFSIERFKVEELLGIFTRDISITGRAQTTLSVTASSATLGTLLDSPTINGTFAIRDGTMSNVDLVQAMRTPGSVGGQTKFTEFSGKVRVSDAVVRYEAMRLAGGVLSASGNVGVASGNGNLNGAVNAEIRSSVAQDRVQFSVGGTVARPNLKRN